LTLNGNLSLSDQNMRPMMPTAAPLFFGSNSEDICGKFLMIVDNLGDTGDSGGVYDLGEGLFGYTVTFKK
jgi:hypothetical protein